MPTLSAFADEISSDLDEQLTVLNECGIRYFDLRGVWGINVLDLTDDQIRDIKTKSGDRGIGVAAIGSPIGKSSIDKPRSYEIERLKRTCDIAENLGTKYVRVFSFYAPEGKSILEYGEEVVNRLSGWIDMVSSGKRTVVLVHENEKEIYGETPDRCVELMNKLYGRSFVNCYDPSNFVEAGVANLFENSWQQLKKYTEVFHLKDCKKSDHKVVPCGEGDGEVGKTLGDAFRGGFKGFMTMEPHLRKAGRFAGFSGSDLFKKAVSAVKSICEANGIPLD